jgi:hypothetical protein
MFLDGGGCSDGRNVRLGAKRVAPRRHHRRKRLWSLRRFRKKAMPVEVVSVGNVEASQRWRSGLRFQDSSSTSTSRKGHFVRRGVAPHD